MTFSETGLCTEIQEAIADLGFTEPTPIQELTIPHLLTSERDLIALAQTGTGKTAAFGLPVLNQLDRSERDVQALMLCPTRELCLQITKDLESYATKMPWLKISAVYGGTSIITQIRELERGVHVVVGTPGRALDLINRNKLKLGSIKWLVLDEADEMLNMGFKEDLDTILASTPAEKQTLLFSATMPAEISRIGKTYMSNPFEISVGKKNTASATIEHQYFMVKARHRYMALKRVVDMNPKIYGIVFCRTRMETKEVADKLMQDGYSADALHGDLSQQQRDYVMNRFRTKQLQILVATDVAARGLDVNELTHVINYNLPDDIEAYVHRSGRTGRAGHLGVSIAVITPSEGGRIRQIERLIGNKFILKQIPNGREICEKQLFSLIDKVETADVSNTDIEEYLPAIYEKLEWMSKEDLIKHLVAEEFTKFLEYYKEAEDINVSGRDSERRSVSRNDRGDRGDRRDRGERRDRGDRGDRGDRRDRGARSERSDRNDRGDRRPENSDRFAKKRFESEKEMARIHINIGKKDDLTVPGLIALINKHSPVRNAEIGKIDILPQFSFFDIEVAAEKQLRQTMNSASFQGRDIVVEASQKPKKRPRSTKQY